MTSTGELWAISAYFNPARYASRLRNYRTFRAHLNVPLVTVELSDTADFELSAADADVLIQVRSADIMWHKERLLNIALETLPAACDIVCWLDCDVVFAAPDWAERTRAALRDERMVQPFRRLCDLPADFERDPSCWSTHAPTRTSYAATLACGVASEILLGPGNAPRYAVTFGHAWAMRRAALGAHQLYDRRIVGSGDKFMLCAALGSILALREHYYLSPQQLADFERWAKPFHDTVQGKVGDVDGLLYHLWHGELTHRNYVSRHRDLQPFDFDPEHDLALNADRCWRWNSDKPDMHRYVRDYLLSRREDG